MKKKSFKKKYELGAQFVDVRPGGTEADYQRIQAAEAAKYAGKGQKTGGIIGGTIGAIGGTIAAYYSGNPALAVMGYQHGKQLGGMAGYNIGAKKGNKIGAQKGQEYVQNLNDNRNIDIQDNSAIANQLMQYSGDESYQNSNLMNYNSSPLGGAILTGGRGNLLSGGVQPGQYSINYGQGSTDFGLAGAIKPYSGLDLGLTAASQGLEGLSQWNQGNKNKISLGQQNSVAGMANMNQALNAANSSFASKGAKSTDAALIEVEKDELVFRKDPKNPNKVRLVADFVGGKSHNQGGEDFVAQDGDIIFPGQKRQAIKALLDQNGYVRDINTFAREVQKLPEDTQEKPMTQEVMMKKGCKSFKTPMYGPGTKRVNARGEVIDDGVEPLSVNNQAVLSPEEAFNFKVNNNITPSIYKGLPGDSFDYNENNPYINFNQQELDKIVANSRMSKGEQPNIPNSVISNYDKQPSKFSSFLRGIPGAVGNFWNNTADERQKAGQFLKNNQGTLTNIANQFIPEIDPQGRLADQTAEAYARSLMAEKPEIRQPTQVSFATQRYQDRSAPLRNQLLLNQKLAMANSRNASAGSGSVLLSNMAQQNAALQNQMMQIENNEALRADQVDLSNTGTNNQQAQINAQFFDQNVTANEHNRAQTRNLGRQGFATLSGLYNSKAMNNYMMQKDRTIMAENQRVNNMKSAMQQDALLFSMAANPQAAMSLAPYFKQKYPEMYSQFEQQYGTEGANQKIAELAGQIAGGLTPSTNTPNSNSNSSFNVPSVNTNQQTGYYTPTPKPFLLEEQYSVNPDYKFKEGTRSFKVKKSYGDGTKEVKVRQNDGSLKTYLTDTPEYRELYEKQGSKLATYNQDDDSWIMGKEMEGVEINDKLPYKNTPKPKEVKWYETLNFKNWGLNDYTSFDSFDKAFDEAKNKENEFVFKGERFTTDIKIPPDYSSKPTFNHAFKQARDFKEREFMYHGSLYNTDLVDKSYSDIYHDSKIFLLDYYSNNNFLPLLNNNPNVVDSLNYYKNYQDTASRKFGEKTFKNRGLTFKDFFNQEKRKEYQQERIDNLKKPAYFSITDVPKKELKNEGILGYVRHGQDIYDDNNQSIHITTGKKPNDPKYTNVAVHELTHKSGYIGQSLEKSVPPVSNTLAKEMLGPKDFEYLTDPTEIEARKMTLLYHFKNTGKNINKMTYKDFISYLDSYENYDKLPTDAKQLLSLYNSEKDTKNLFKYLRNDFSYD